jgi:diaminopimelate epimerase
MKTEHATEPDMKTLTFTKMSGAGNDFIMVNNAVRSLSIDWPPFAVRFCALKTGVGADGVIVLSPDTGTDFSFRIFNADGSEAEMCGNGARCAARFAYQQGLAGKSMRFTTLAGVVGARIEDEDVAIRMTDPFDLNTAVSIEVHRENMEVHFINTGVPHTIVFTDRIEEIPVKELGRSIRWHERFSPSGTNVDFVKVLGPDSIHVRTYERGVEDETYACGTGAVASALVSHFLGKIRNAPVQVRTKGGDLKIDFSGNGGSYQDVWLIGPVATVFTGEILLEP